MSKECCNINEAIQEFYDYLKNFIQSKVHDAEVANDLVQEVMLKLIESHQKNVPVANVKAWLFQISKNVIFDYFKSHKLETSPLNDFENYVTPDQPDETADDYVIQMISMLPEKDKEILLLNDIEQLPQQKIAQHLNIGISAVKMRVKRAREKLRSQFDSCCEITYDKNGGFVSCSIKKYC